MASWDPREAPPPPEGDTYHLTAFVTRGHGRRGFNERKAHAYFGMEVRKDGDVIWRRVFSWMRGGGKTGWDAFSNDGMHAMPEAYGLPRRAHDGFRTWDVDRAGFVACFETLRHAIEHKRYRLLIYNCIHFAWALLGAAGVQPARPPDADERVEIRAPAVAAQSGLGPSPPVWPFTMRRLTRRWHLASVDRQPIPKNVGDDG